MGLFPLQGRALTAAITMTCGFSFMLFGWDQGVFGGILNDPTFAKQFHHPNATIQGQIVSTYDIGCIIGAVISIYLGDKLGRRKSIAMSCGFVIVGGLLQATSFSLAHIIVGRVVAGLGIGQSTAVIPMWQAETSKPEHRGKLVALQMVMVIFGIDLTSWLNLGMTYVYENEVSWRFPIAMQCFWAFVTLGLLSCTVESPRWLCYKERHAEAQVVLARLAAKDHEEQSVKIELKIISDAIAAEKAGGAIGWREVFSGGEHQNFRRLVLGAGTSVFQQMGGINVVSFKIPVFLGSLPMCMHLNDSNTHNGFSKNSQVVYYFPVILTKSFGFSNRLALILSAIDFISLCVWGSVIMLLIDRFGRVPLMLFGSIGCGICFTLTTVGLGIGTKASYAMAVSFMFGYHLFYVRSISSSLSILKGAMLTLSFHHRACPSSLFRFYILPKSTRRVCAALGTALPW